MYPTRSISWWHAVAAYQPILQLFLQESILDETRTSDTWWKTRYMWKVMHIKVLQDLNKKRNTYYLVHPFVQHVLNSYPLKVVSKCEIAELCMLFTNKLIDTDKRIL